MATAAEIRAARAWVDETQDEFARRFGVDRSAVAKWERHGPPPSGTARILIDRILAEITQNQ